MTRGGYMGTTDRAISAGKDAIVRELDRQRAILKGQEEKRWSRETSPRSRFAVAAHITKTEHKIRRLEMALEERGMTASEFCESMGTSLYEMAGVQEQIEGAERG